MRLRELDGYPVEKVVAVRWRATPPDDDPSAQDSWVAFHRSRTGLSASSWPGFLCSIDQETGAIRSAVFTK